MQSHDEMAFVEALHPGRRDAEIFDAVGLSLSPNPVTLTLAPTLTSTGLTLRPRLYPSHHPYPYP